MKSFDPECDATFLNRSDGADKLARRLLAFQCGTTLRVVDFDAERRTTLPRR